MGRNLVIFFKGYWLVVALIVFGLSKPEQKTVYDGLYDISVKVWV